MIIPALLSVIIGSKPLVLVHYMPWYESKSVSGKWGWHWTMNHFDPEVEVGGRRQIASKLYPLIGPYDSNDLDALEYQAQLMKLAGIDGAIIDWYGYDDVYDYSINHRNTLQFIQVLKRAGLKFSICYEDQTLPNLIKFGKLNEADAVPYASKLMAWVKKNWFDDPSYVRANGKPVFLVFGPTYYKAPQWPVILKGLDVSIFGVNGQYDFATGGFAWPYPKEGIAQTENFYKWSKDWKGFIAGAYPRFEEVYGEAKTQATLGVIPDDKGRTFQRTFEMALESKSPVIQIATWNDWGEGTVIEPSVEYGYRDLEFLQKRTKSGFEPDDLRLPIDLYRRRKGAKASEKALLDNASLQLMSGRPSLARMILRDSN